MTTSPASPRQTLSYLRTLFEERGIRPKSNFGQNFLIDLNLVDLIVRKQVFEGVTSARSTSYVFLGRKDGFSRQPAEILESEGVSLFQTQLVDLDGDGRPDLVVPYTSFGVFALIRMLTAKTAKVDFQIYPFDRKTRKFALEPVSDRELKFRIPLAGDSDLQAVSLTADVTGDGRPDLIFGWLGFAAAWGQNQPPVAQAAAARGAKQSLARAREHPLFICGESRP